MNVIDSSQSDILLKQITLMCVSVSFAFIIFIAPSVILLVGKVYWQQYESYQPIKSINNLFVYCNHSINFYLYLLTGKKFRDETLKLLSCGRETIHCIFCNMDCPRSLPSNYRSSSTCNGRHSRKDSTTSVRTLASVSDGQLRPTLYSTMDITA